MIKRSNQNNKEMLNSISLIFNQNNPIVEVTKSLKMMGISQQNPLVEATKPLRLMGISQQNALVEATKPLRLMGISQQNEQVEATKPLRLMGISQQNEQVEATKPLRLMGISQQNALVEATKPLRLMGISQQNALVEATKPLRLMGISQQNALFDATKPLRLMGISQQNALVEATKPLKLMGISQQSALVEAIKPLRLMGISQQNGLVEATRLILHMDSSLKKFNSSIQFKNLILPTQTVEKYYPMTNSKEVKSIFEGISSNTFSVKSQIKNDSIKTVIIQSENKLEIPIKSVFSTVGATDLLGSISKEDILSFYLYLSRFPMLGGEHEVGRRIIDEINKVKTIVPKCVTLYRARPRDIKKRALPYSPEEMFTAPFGLSNQGRYNLVGQGELYACNNKEVAIMECAKDNQTTVDVIEWELNENVSLIDLTDKESPLVQYCSFSAETSSGLEYLVPNFIAQCAKSRGITGIVFQSTQVESALNYVFFDYQKNWFKTINFYELLTA
ncbi:RES family NAD+ phosphorylase [Sutcliffiella deserti]|uniref:RES family NAD+ phosphorylase n=1 Tax=Sutcliffiella deserti TaxID=2875501 RepID=UPI001CC043D2|nr:RES family NAD+ phosphorylase [Sutcliffiella deserti]